MFCLVAVVFVSLVLMVLVRRYTFWNRLGVSQYDFHHIWWCNVVDFFKQTPLTTAMVQLFEDFKSARYVGTYQLFIPRLCIMDPSLIKQVLVKDFDHFVDHNNFIPTDGDVVWEKSLFALKGTEWRHMRAIGSPTFTSSKMKIMFNSMVNCSKQFLEYLDKRHDEVITLEMKDVFGRLTSDVYFITHFGIACNSLLDRDNEFYRMGRLGADFTGLSIKLRFLLIQMCPRITKLFGLKVFDQSVNAFFRRLVRKNIYIKKHSKTIRPDFIQLLMNNKKGDVELTDEEVVAFAMAFFGGGFDSVSTLLSFVFYELALDTQVQHRLQEEIDSYNTRIISYNTLQQMKYLDMVISETLRKWPGGFFLERQCIKPYTIQPVNDCEVPVHLTKGDQIWIPLYALQRHPKWFKNPDTFIPERFSSDTRINSYTYMPFGAGPRHCIGNRYATLVAKVVVYHFFAKYIVKPINKTASPVRLSRSYFQLIPKDQFWLGCQKREYNQ